MSNKYIKKIPLDTLKKICLAIEVDDGDSRKALYLHKSTGTSIAKCCSIFGLNRTTFQRYLKNLDDKIGEFVKEVVRVK